MKTDKDFMDSTELNDEIKEFVLSLFPNKEIEAYVNYNSYSDGKHKLMLNGKEIQVNAWMLRVDLKDELVVEEELQDEE